MSKEVLLVVESVSNEGRTGTVDFEALELAPTMATKRFRRRS
jgi:hypothetical protein